MKRLIVEYPVLIVCTILESPHVTIETDYRATDQTLSDLIEPSTEHIWNYVMTGYRHDHDNLGMDYLDRNRR